MSWIMRNQEYIFLEKKLHANVLRPPPTRQDELDRIDHTDHADHTDHTDHADHTDHTDHTDPKYIYIAALNHLHHQAGIRGRSTQKRKRPTLLPLR